MAEQGIFLCNKSDLTQTGAYGISIETNAGMLDIVVVALSWHASQHNSQTLSDRDFKAYINSCPHLGMPMETFDHEFLDKQDSSLIVCSTHGARFRIEDGFCLSGPCSGSSLKPIPLTFTEEAIFVNAQIQ